MTDRPKATFANWSEGHIWIMSELGGLDSAGQVLANPFTEAEIVQMALETIRGPIKREVLGRALEAMGWTSERLSRLETP